MSNEMGFAAVTFLHCGAPDCYAWQRKTPGYPYLSQVGGLCLFGGNRDVTDVDARSTLERELREELPAEWASAAIQSLQPFSRFVIRACADVMAPKPAYSFTVSVFTATVSNAAVKGLPHVNEGTMEIVPVQNLLGEKFCWGYDTVFRSYLQATYPAVDYTTCLGDSVIEVTQIKSDEYLGEWANAEAWR